ncbi:MAG: hypothetical protein ACTSU5_11770 [Promethearchaeota archaeon]
MGKYYRGYILCRLGQIGTEWEVVEKVLKLAPEDAAEDWKITYASPVYGMWDLIVEVSFSKLAELDTVVTFLRHREEFRDKIEETSTLVSSKPNYPLE